MDTTHLEQESPSFDVLGVKRDRAWVSLIGLAHKLQADKPSIGKQVTVTKSRLHKGKVGTVFYHAVCKWSKPFQYSSSMGKALTQARGTFGYRVGVLTVSGERFFVTAENVAVVK